LRQKIQHNEVDGCLSPVAATGYPACQEVAAPMIDL
jgi:hypothetical protein